ETFAALLAAGLDRPRTGTAFDRAVLPPTAPAEFSRWTDDPDRARWPIGAGLVATVVLGAVAAIVRGRRRAAWLGGLGAVAAGSVERGVEVDSPPRWVTALLVQPTGGKLAARVAVGTSPAGLSWGGVWAQKAVRTVSIRLRNG